MNGQEVITLKDYIDRRFAELDKRLKERFDLTDRALLSANGALEARLEQLNEFRAQILEERGVYARRDEMELRLKPIEERSAYGSGQTAGKEWAIGLFLAIGLSLAALIVNLVV